MQRWFYAVMTEKNGWYNVAVKADSLDSAKSKLSVKYPHAIIQQIERGDIV